MTVSERTALLGNERTEDGSHSVDSSSTDGISREEEAFSVQISKPRLAALVSCIWLTWFIGSFDSTLMASSHPVISTYFGASNHATWFSTSFLITSCSFSPIFARASDTFGRRVPLLISLIVFSLGTLWCSLAPTTLSFISARAFCGLGAGASLSQSITLISDIVPLRRRGAYISWVNLAYGTGSSLGAVLGGVLAETIGWRWEFGIQVPAILFLTLVVSFVVPSNLGPEFAKHNPQTLAQTLRSFDLLGSVLLTSTVACLVVILTIGGNSIPWTHPLIPVLCVLFVVLTIALIRVEQQTSKAVLPLHLLARKPGGHIVWSNFLSCMSMSTVLFNIPLFFQAVLLDTPAQSGMRLMTPFLWGMAAAFAAGHLVSHSGKLLPLILIGYILLLLGLVIMTIMPETLPSQVYSLTISLPLVGQGFAFPTLIMAQLAATSHEDAAVATATLLLLKNLGNVIGVAVSGLVSQNALYYYLEKFIQPGEEKQIIIEKVRKTVEIIRHLHEPIRSQVVSAYIRTMHLTFLQATVTCGLALFLILIIRLPSLTKTHRTEV